MKKILQVFKKKKDRKKSVYICDPWRNRDCDKRGCWWVQKQGPCKCTTKKKCALRGDDGKPVIAADEDMYNLDYWDEKIKDLGVDALTDPENSQKKQGL